MLHICKYGNPVLRVKAEPVDRVSPAIGRLASEMTEIMLQASGVGLAAQQVGKTVRIFVMHVPPQYDLADCLGAAGEPDGKRLNPEINAPLVVINPVLLEKKGSQVDKEGCLSFPEIFAPVHRAYEVALSFIDLQGRQRRIDVRGLMARVVQHELDHLDGILFVDRLSALKKISLAARLKRLKRANSPQTFSAES